MATAAEAEALRGGIEREFNTLRNELEEQFIVDRAALRSQLDVDIKANRLAKEAAMRDAGLNTDGSDPQGRPSG